MTVSDQLPSAAARPPNEACPGEPPGAPAPRGNREREIRRVFLVTLALNLLVAAAKGSYGWYSGSLALGTDAMHSVLDGSANVLALIGLHFSTVPADPGHPYGHRKVETLAAVGIGVLIVIGLFELAQAAVRSLLDARAAPAIGWPGFVIVAGTMVVNAFVSHYEHRQGETLGSQLLRADARHTQSDLYASGAVLLSFAAGRAGLAWADSIGSLVLVVLVGRVAWTVFRENLPTLMDAAALDPARVVALASAWQGVAGVHKVRSRGAPGVVHLDLHIQVAPEMSVLAAHDLAHDIEKALRASFPEVSDVVIHIEPSSGPPRP